MKGKISPFSSFFREVSLRSLGGPGTPYCRPTCLPLALEVLGCKSSHHALLMSTAKILSRFGGRGYDKVDCRHNNLLYHQFTVGGREQSGAEAGVQMAIHSTKGNSLLFRLESGEVSVLRTEQPLFSR